MDIFCSSIYQKPYHDNKKFLLRELENLTSFHYDKCELYRRMLTARSLKPGIFADVDKIPFIPVRLFKYLKLQSIPDELIFKVLRSSGTTNQSVSRVVLDHETAASQTKALIVILQQFIGKERLPMLIIDSPSILKNRMDFSARSAGIIGISNFGRSHTYALNDDMTLNEDHIFQFLHEHKNKKILIFGFTFMVWKHFYQEIKKKQLRFDFSGATLLHSGGWKKLIEESVSADVFKRKLYDEFDILKIHDFYGMAEQVGSIFVECEFSRMHTPSFADVLVRDPFNWSVLPPGQIGVLQVLSVLPRSYPGHSLLTEDLGELIGIDDCRCGRLGKTFKVHGRIPTAELRGCSDTQASAS